MYSTCICDRHISARGGQVTPYIIAVCKYLSKFTNDCGIRVVVFQYSKYTTKANQLNVSFFIGVSKVLGMFSDSIHTSASERKYIYQTLIVEDSIELMRR
jgi:hypothetical protein